MRKRTSPIWNISKKELNEIVKNSNSLSEILKFFGLCYKGGNGKTLKKRLEEDGIDYFHIPLGRDSNKGRKIPKKAKPLKEIMIENSTYSRYHLKKRLIKEKILKERCYNCGLPSFWDGKKLVLILDHINGISNDNRLENLRLLCPNCNSQTDTFAGKRLKKYYYCKKCGTKVSRNFDMCKKCNGLQRRKVERPIKKDLLEDISKLGYVGAGKKYGVSDNAIRKWLK